VLPGSYRSFPPAGPISRFPERRQDPSNLQWVHYRVNEMKKDWIHEEFLAFIGLLQSRWALSSLVGGLAQEAAAL